MVMTKTQGNEPLQEYNLLHSNDVDISRKIVTDMYCEHELVPLVGDEVNAKLNAVEGDQFNFGFLTYGVDAKIVLPALPSCYHVNITLAGNSIVDDKQGSSFHTDGMNSGAILLPEHTYDVIWKKNTRQYAFKFHQKKLERHLETLIYEKIDSSIAFDTVFDLTSTTGQGLVRACLLLQTEWEQNSTIAFSPVARRHLESFIMSSFLIAAKNQYSEKLLVDYKTKELNEELVRCVKDYLHENIDQLPCLTDLTSFAKVSARTLQLAFKRYANCSPMEYVQKLRLQRAHEQIVNARHTGDKITSIAMEWGFYNPGRFSQLYKKEYGCTPREMMIKNN